jgi:CubicO group peptidase (beta-lactamase class C family)
LRASIAALFALTAALSAQAAPDLNDVPALESFFDGAMQVGMVEHHVTGAVVAIVKDGRTLFAKGYGKGDLARQSSIDPATSLFRIGSTTKAFTWTAVMQLVEQGKIDLDKDVNAYLKGVRIPDTYQKPVTLRSIMTHTAGFEEGFVGYLIQSDPRKQQPIIEALKTHMPARVRPAGEMSSYSNYGAALAGLIVEQVSGVPYNEYIIKNILEPLDMQFSTVQEPVPQRLAPYVTTGYQFKDGGEVAKPYEIVGGFRPAGSGAMSALDMTHFMLAHLQEGRYEDRQILRPETARLMRTTAFTPDKRFPGMALGFYHQDINGIDAFGHGGDTLYCHTDMLLLPKQNVGIFVSFNTEDNRVRDKVLQAFFNRYFPRTTPLPKRLDDAEARGLAEIYAGSYQWTRRNHSDIDKLANLFSGLSVAPLENGNLVVGGLGADPLQFEPIATDLYREVHDEMQISFRSGSGGNVTHMFVSILPFMPTERTPWYETKALWFTLLGASVLVFLGALAGTYYRWREIKLMPVAEKRAIWIGAAVAAWAVLTWVVIGVVVAAAGVDQVIETIPASLSAALLMPLAFVVLTVLSVIVTFKVWRDGFWTLGRRAGYTLIAIAAVIFCVFYWQWNLLGWHYG